ncbi:protein of unknown function DUF3456 [Cynara cardunculus var. scolymus]|uniref:Saposin B-type domain-containing protein n=1 Tax=Cynara cardunculus var. scolymus TaxID=59895 RepID=A0A103XNE4_CYNCS|nr:protein of unknown function DUF3456 [Cynara cardunculus var. scolymus]
MDRKLVFNLLFWGSLLCSSWIQTSYCAKPAGVARKDDIPFIKCQVCEKLAKELFEQVRDKQAKISPKKISEYEVIEISENVCNLKKQEADWMLKIDIVEKGDRLELVEQDSEGQCGSECKTIERACQEVIGYYDTDVAEYIYKKKPQMHSLSKFLCKDLTKGKIMKEKESMKMDWKQKVKKGVIDAGEAAKKHATKMGFRLQKWWKGKKASFTQHNSNSAKNEL